MHHTVVERHHDEVKMNGKRPSMAIFGSALLLAAGGCNREAEAAPDTEAATPAKDEAPPASPEAKAPIKLTAGELSAGKKKLRFTLALPEGLREVRDGLGGGGMVSYRKNEKGYDGYSITVGIDPRGTKDMLKPMKAALLAELEEAKKTKKAAVLSQGDWDNGGWYFSGSFEEAGKPYVTMMSRIVVGDAVLMCRGDGEGEVAKTPEATAKVLVEACKSVKVTSP